MVRGVIGIWEDKWDKGETVKKIQLRLVKKLWCTPYQGGGADLGAVAVDGKPGTSASIDTAHNGAVLCPFPT